MYLLELLNLLSQRKKKDPLRDCHTRLAPEQKNFVLGVFQTVKDGIESV
jgi:hypothetical protein